MAKKEKVKKLKRVTDISAKDANSIKGGKTCSCSCQTENERAGMTLKTFTS